jgi:hypothetical protein
MKSKLHFKLTADFLLLDSFDRKCFPDDEPHDFTKDRSWIIYEDEGNLLGFCSLTPLNRFTVFLSRAGVLQEGQGVQRPAIHYRTLWAKRNGYSKVISYAAKDNFKSVANFVKAGFEFYDPQYAWAGRSFFYFMKELK